MGHNAGLGGTAELRPRLILGYVVVLRKKEVSVSNRRSHPAGSNVQASGVGMWADMEGVFN